MTGIGCNPPNNYLDPVTNIWTMPSGAALTRGMQLVEVLKSGSGLLLRYRRG